MTKRTKTIKAMLYKLRADMPPLLPVRVYVRERINEENWLGACSLKQRDGKPSHFVIELRKSSNQTMFDTLMHEWAHAVAWRHGHETVSDHDPEWALAYSRIYQLLVDA